MNGNDQRSIAKLVLEVYANQAQPAPQAAPRPAPQAAPQAAPRQAQAPAQQAPQQNQPKQPSNNVLDQMASLRSKLIQSGVSNELIQEFDGIYNAVNVMTA